MSKADPFLLVLLASSLAGNVILYRSVPTVSAAAPTVSIVGKRAKPLVGYSVTGAPMKVVVDHPAIIYAFSPDCVWCDRNLDNVRSLKKQIGDRYHFVGVALKDQGLSDYLRRHQLDWEVIRRVDPQLLARYQLVGTPQTVVVGKDGLVQYAWSGAYGPADQKSIERALGVTLPGLAMKYRRLP